MLISYAIVGLIVFTTMLSLGEMAAFIPVAGSFCTFAGQVIAASNFLDPVANNIRTDVSWTILSALL